VRVVVKKWGNSASVRIPAAVMEAAHLQLNEPVEIREEDGRIIIDPIPRREYRLADLVAGITPENMHEPIDFGAPIGKEIW
jgi:antitoxin MazE